MAYAAMPGGLSEDYAYSRCRDLRHSWGEVATTGEMEGLVERVLTCARCGTTRTEEFEVSGRWGLIRKVRHRYRYPEGYLLKARGISAGRTAEQARLIDIFRALGGRG